MRKINSIVYGLILTILLLAGCEKKDVPKGFPKLYPVTLELVQAENPLAEATVSLYPVDAASHWSCGGFSDANGRAVLATHGGHNGVPAGKYKVAVIKAIIEGTPATMDEPGTSATFSLIERKYTSQKTTTLEIDVQPGQNHFRLDVGSPVKNKL